MPGSQPLDANFSSLPNSYLSPDILREIRATQLLLSIDGFAYGRYWQLMEVLARPSAVFELPQEALEPMFSQVHLAEVRKLRDEAQHPAKARFSQCMEWCDSHKVRIIHHLSPEYPPLLKEIHKAPPLLYLKGNTCALQEQQVAIVGSRNATANGLEQAKWVAKSLVESGFAVTSGLALGIDSQAHIGALAGGGVTLAVMGTGIDQVYPFRNRKLAESIVAEGGALVSEFPLGTVAAAQNFPRRNRIISGLSLGTLVVEAAIKSGSLITAQYALEQNREVFALPGSTQSRQSRGCHYLIKQGASLVENAQDIVAELNGFCPSPLPKEKKQSETPESHKVSNSATESKRRNALSDKQKSLIKHIAHDPISLDQLVVRTQWPVSELMAELMALELLGKIDNESGLYTCTFERVLND